VSKILRGVRMPHGRSMRQPVVASVTLRLITPDCRCLPKSSPDYRARQQAAASGEPCAPDKFQKIFGRDYSLGTSWATAVSTAEIKKPSRRVAIDRGRDLQLGSVR
jgi:hypothetical protein